ncbi:potassium transporter Trk [Pradoshia eiseniae]|uniref:precorrin-2 dehydrogenase n=1 Tax=Pradoshia eiseniae TaxID=2064768 RepID=A0A2S7MYB9_9BACI|nr:NAD(P)-dependent oxidoreductase [Pradoshia eiseniae]PQD94801.1 potassium transporter Trk [Pradoshia eiseniae]
MQPLIIDLSGKKVIIAGGGRIATRKAKVLSAEKALITFIAPEISEEARSLAKEYNYELIEREALPNDFSGAMLVILATNSRTVNASLVNILPPNQLVCVVDESGEGNVTFPATVRRGHLQIAVTSNGSSPKLTRKLKRELEEQFDESWIGYTAWLYEMRKKVKQLDLPFEEKQQILWDILADEYKDEAARQRAILLSQG